MLYLLYRLIQPALKPLLLLSLLVLGLEMMGVGAAGAVIDFVVVTAQELLATAEQLLADWLRGVIGV
jgi:hypothetical protein